MVRAAKSKIAQKEKNDLLYRAILTLKNEEECYSFFQDLCTISELRSMEQRYEVATLLNDGMLYSDILEKTGASSATISRVRSRWSFSSKSTSPCSTPPGTRSSSITPALAIL